MLVDAVEDCLVHEEYFERLQTGGPTGFVFPPRLIRDGAAKMSVARSATGTRR
jgi:hypothetical protein